MAEVSSKTHRVRRVILWILAILLTLVLTGGALLVFAPDKVLRGLAGEKGSNALGREFSIDGPINIDWDWTQPRVTLDKVRLANMADSKEPNMLEIAQVDFRIRIWRLLLGQLNFPALRLVEPRIMLEKRDEKTANWQLPAFSKANAVGETVMPDSRDNFPIIGSLAIDNGRLVYEDKPKNLTLDLKLEKAEGGSGGNGEAGFRLAGDGKLQGKIFELRAAGGALDMLRNSNKPYPLDFRLVMGGTKINVTGTFTDPVQMTGVDAKLDLSGDNLADLFHVTGIPLPPTPAYKLNGHLMKESNVWRFEDFKGGVGGSDLSGNLSYDIGGERGFIKAALTSQLLDMDDLAGFVGATAKKEKITSPEQKAQAERDAADARLMPDVKLDLSRLRAADMDVRLTAKRINAPGLPMNDMDVRFLLKEGVLRLDPLNFGIANGDISGWLVLDGSKDLPQVQSDLRLKKLALKSFFKDTRFAEFAAGAFGGRFQLTGQGRSLAEVMATSDGRVTLLMSGGKISMLIIEAAGLDVGQASTILLGEDEATNIRCAVGDFRVENGVLNSDAFVFDTTDSNMGGEAHIDLKDETINARLEVHPKDPSLFSARTPITISGRMKKPTIGLDPTELAARGGVAAVLSVFLTPAAAVIPFIELGLGEDSDCASLIQQARSAAANAKAAPVKAKENDKSEKQAEDKPSPAQ